MFPETRDFSPDVVHKNVEVVDGVVRHTKPTVDFKTFLNDVEHFDATGDARILQTSFSGEDVDIIKDWLVNMLYAHARRNQDHVVLSWAFFKRQLETILYCELYFDSDDDAQLSRDQKFIKEIVNEFCTEHHLKLTEYERGLLIGWK